MPLTAYRYDGSRPLTVKDLPTGAGDMAREKKALVKKTEKNMAQAALLQEKLFAAGREGLIIALQARDAAGKDSLIKKVFGKLNPAALEVPRPAPRPAVRKCGSPLPAPPRRGSCPKGPEARRKFSGP